MLRDNNDVAQMLLDLEQCPENIVNSLFATSYDEMPEKERAAAIAEIGQRLRAEMARRDELLQGGQIRPGN